MRFFSLFTVVVCFNILIACTKDVGPNPDLVKINSCDTISFSKHVKPIIEANCISCHTPGGIGNGDFTTDIYAGLKSKADNNTLRARAVDLTIAPTMPLNLPPLPEEQRNIIRCWIEAGAQNN